MDPMLGRLFAELQQHIGVIDDLGDRLAVLGAVIDLECLDRDLGAVDIRVFALDGGLVLSDIVSCR